jgi:hypothetical protein
MVEVTGKVRVVWRIRIWEPERNTFDARKVSIISLDAISNGIPGNR